MPLVANAWETERIQSKGSERKKAGEKMQMSQRQALDAAKIATRHIASIDAKRKAGKEEELAGGSIFWRGKTTRNANLKNTRRRVSHGRGGGG